MATAAKPDIDTSKTGTFIVARRRTVLHNGKHYEAGAEIPLPVEEGVRLRKLGFFVDEDGTETFADNGPKTINGVEIREL